VKLILRVAGNESPQTGANAELCQKSSQVICGDSESRGSPSVEKNPRGITATLKRRSGSWKTKAMFVLDASPRVAKCRTSKYERDRKQRDNHCCNLDDASIVHARGSAA
jgi:hypothetical protein